MSLERLARARNGLLEVRSDGPLCWYDDVQELAEKIEQILKDAGPMENRDATLKSILELLK